MNAKDMQISQQRQQEIARNARMHRQATEAHSQAEVVIEVTPGKTPFILVAFGKLVANLTSGHESTMLKNEPKHHSGSHA